MTALLQLHDVGVSFNGFVALHEVALEVRAGEILAVLGPSGAGKSTLLSVLAGALRPTSGTVHFRGVALQRVAQRTRLAALRRVDQDPLGSLNPAVTVQQVVAEAHQNLCGRGASAAAAAVAPALAAVGLGPLRPGSLPRELSAGQRQRVALARALVTEPAVLLADEPLAALDPVAAAALLRLVLQERAERGMAAVLVLHDPTAVPLYADRFVVLDEGRVVDTGRGAQLFAATHPVTRSLCGFGD